ncbi:MAG: PaaI family thioesterase [Bacteroidota bacterium]|nr:PaaI family thioesterase [Bacteroidota bacterium]
MQFTAEHVEIADRFCQNTLISHLGIKFLVDEEGRLCATMPVESRTHQPVGLLHGGATAALAESLGSMSSSLLIDRKTHGVVGIEVNANHLKGVRTGKVKATGNLIHKGRTTHVWDIRVTNEAGELCAVCRLTNLIIEQR